MQGTLIVICLSRCRHSGKGKHQQDVSAHAMILVYGLGIIWSTVKTLGIVLSDSYQRLQDEKDIGYKPEDGMRGDEVCPSMVDLIVFYDDQAGYEGKDGSDVEDSMDVSALMLLFGSVGRLEDENGLGDE